MARPAEENLVRRRRRALLVAAALAAIPVGIAVRQSGDWATYGAAAGLLLLFVILGSLKVLGPWTREASEWNPGPAAPAHRGARRHANAGEQLVIERFPGRSRVHARH